MIAANKYVPSPSLVHFDEEAKAEAVDVQKLGRCRPGVFASTWKEVAFVASMLGSLAMAVSTLFPPYHEKLWANLIYLRTLS
jgi:hypothetical protein